MFTPVADFEMGQLHQRRVKNDALRIAHFADRLDHGVILSFTSPCVKYTAAKVRQAQRARQAVRSAGSQFWEAR